MYNAIRLAQAQASITAMQSAADNQDWEEEVLLRAACLQLDVQAALATVGQYTLDLTSQTQHAGEMYDALVEAREAIQDLRSGAVHPPRADLARPTLKEFRRWQDLMLNDEMADHAQRQERLAQERQSPHLAPVRWRISTYEPNGYFEAHCTDADTQSALYGWAPVPAAAPSLLRGWSVPAARPMEVIWECTPQTPRWQLPLRGHGPGHRGHLPEHRRQPSVSLTDAWQATAEAHEARFAAMMKQVQEHWPADASITENLTQRADHLNATEPLAPDLEIHSTVHREGEDLDLGETVTAGWIDPAAVAATGARRLWNDFTTHRPTTVPAMAAAMLSGSLEQALTVWSLCRDPVCVYRIPGPAGPLYQLGVNGTHRLHAARLLGMPALWAEITHEALPVQVNARRLAEYGHVPQLLTCWRGLLAAGLATGTLQEDTDLPGMSCLRLDSVVAPWLLIRPDHAVAWAAIYDRTYPGALEEQGIPATAWRTGQSWFEWLSEKSR
ncbi:hypothetical protein ACFQVD_30325 [Streptosporangium amethystogenes subsp. fukuiense]|uniref:ParB/Sulfiredoxin domain-containing protein n=1 Tax=Streptosporangium amethystogenes subsp. fukuiense TaxID=698418 RepID=A0ABW2TA87_9ACTN